MRISIELPFFPGFYESDLYNSDTSYWAIKEELEYYYQQDLLPEHPEYQYLTEDDLDFRFEDYCKDVRDAFVEVWKDHAPEIVEGIEFDEMVSPKYYNFSTDRLFAFVELRDDWKDVMRGFIKDNYEWLKKRIEDDWTSYDGFCSFMENDIREWDRCLFEEEDCRYISTMLGYMMYREDKNIRNELVMCTLEDIYAGSYVFIIPEAEKRVQEEYEHALETGAVKLKVHDPAQLQLPFDTL